MKIYKIELLLSGSNKKNKKHMASFTIRVNNDHAFDKIMDIVRERSLTHSKDSVGGTVSIEILGSPTDYKIFEDFANSFNKAKGYTSVSIDLMNI